MPWHTLLVLGGIGSGRLECAEELLADPGSDAGGPSGAGGSADRTRSGPHRITAGTPAELAGLAAMLAGAGPDQRLLVEDLGGWLPVGADGAPESAELAALVAAIRACPARLVLVSAEVGLQTTPTTAGNRRLADALGAINRAVAGAVDAVALVVAGQPSWLKGGPAAREPATADSGTGDPTAGPATARPATASAATAGAVPDPARAAAPAGLAAAPAAAGSGPELADLTGLPTPDEASSAAAADHLAPAGLGALAEVISFAAGCQGTVAPQPWQRIRVLVLQGDHRGAAGAGAVGSAGAARALREGHGPLPQLAGQVSAELVIVATAAAEPIEDGPAMPDEQVGPALGHGWRLAEQAADEGIDLLVLASIGDGAETGAAAVAAMLAPGTEPAGLLGWVRTSQGTIDDRAWMRRCAAIRDAVRRARAAGRSTGRPVLAELGGPGLATATGLLLGAAARRTPVLLDGPVGAAAGLVARNLAAPARRWWLLPDTGGHPLVRQATGPLGLHPLLDLRLELGEGAGALAALPLLQTALTLAATLRGGHPS
jgi:NaMN:DMB phosphoribosyltransferase/adenosyl cobinamide kinase/adenosyl cobinamide phosphate guanylyltransferase